jgi:hypothetical protein
LLTYVRICYKKCHENSTDGLAIDTRLEREREGERERERERERGREKEMRTDRKKEMKRSSYFSFLSCTSQKKALKIKTNMKCLILYIKKRETLR